MLHQGVREPAASPWASTVVFAPKKDELLRFCGNRRRLNSVTVRNTYAIPKLDESINSIGDVNLFWTLDRNLRYWRSHMTKQYLYKTTFTCRAGTYRFSRMPFGLTNAAATFQRALGVILSRFKWQSWPLYLDDVISSSRDIHSHIKHVKKTLNALNCTRVRMKLMKCSFFTKRVYHLGQIIEPKQLRSDLVETKSLLEAEHLRG